MGRQRRIIIPGTTHSVSRRTTRRYFLFTPDTQRRVERSFWYTLAWTAQKHGVVVHTAVLMSTHIHYVATDVRGVMPLFKQEFHRLFAQCVKAIRGWPEEVFNKAQSGD
ncbi:MAG TPA: hypothetical protein ENK57_20510, partial [Polyangiaceae bacterium]|nr:hypothetical protein [Polyangiaceae bacterium]